MKLTEQIVKHFESDRRMVGNESAMFQATVRTSNDVHGIQLKLYGIQSSSILTLKEFRDLVQFVTEVGDTIK